VNRKILESYGLPAMRRKYVGERKNGLVEDLASYSIISENNAAQYYLVMPITIHFLPRKCTYTVRGNQLQPGRRQQGQPSSLR